MSNNGKGIYIKTGWILNSVVVVLLLTGLSFLFIFASTVGPMFTQRSDLASAGFSDGEKVFTPYEVPEDEYQENTDASNLEPEETQEEIIIPEGYKQHIADASEIYQGNMILINKDHACAVDGENLVSLLSNGNGTFLATDYEVLINAEIVENVNNMFYDFYEYRGDGVVDVMVNSAYRSAETQDFLFNNEVNTLESTHEAEMWVARPGYSEHQTGVTFDLSLLYYDEVLEFDGSGIYGWINENCYKYGFVVRYRTDKVHITGISNEPWHFRYVGEVHAEYMHKNNLCFEEYAAVLKTHKFDNPILTTDFEAGEYKIYYMKATGDTTIIPVSQTNEYTVSGNNIDGFIVTEKIS